MSDLFIIFIFIVGFIYMAWKVVNDDELNDFDSKGNKTFHFNSMFDDSNSYQDTMVKKQIRTRQAVAGLFTLIMLSDGHISRTELDIVKKFLSRYFSNAHALDVLQNIKRMRERNSMNIGIYCNWLNLYYTYQQRFIFIEALFEVASAENGIDNYQWQTITNLMNLLHIGASNQTLMFRKYQSFRAQTGYSYQQNSQQGGYSYNNGGYNNSGYHYQGSRSGQNSSQNNNNKYYKALGLQPGASKDQVKKAYHLLARKYHPDLQNDPKIKEEYTKKMALINEAYNMLK